MTNTSSTWDALAKRLDSIEKPVSTFRLCQDTDIRDRFREAQYANEQAQRALKDLPKDAAKDARAIYQREAREAAAELADAKKAYDDHVIVLRFTALERKDLEKLQKANPPTEADEAAGQEYAMDTFAPALIAAASLDGMPADAAQKYLDTWHSADAAGLWNAAWTVQHQQRTDLGKG
jgi:predicted NBD/HSP70 family sugar kinase